MRASHSIMLTAIYVMTVAIFAAVVGAPEWGVILSLCAWVGVVISSVCGFFEWREDNK